MILLLLLGGPAHAQDQAGSIRGAVFDRDFEAPLPLARVTIVETGQTVQTSDQGLFAFGEVAPGTYTLIFAKAGFVRQVRADVVVSAGQLTDLEVWLSGEFEDMEEFIVQDALALAPGSEAALLQLRIDSPSLMDSISADLMSRAGASDAASALRLVTGATVQDGRFAVIRGLPDRYVSSQVNGVRLPSADEDTRAVELDQYPAAVIESLQISKTFTPDQQGDASGGAVDVRLKGIPDETIFEFKTQLGFNDQVRGESDFLSYRGGGVDFWGKAGSEKDIQFNNIGGNWDGAVGVKTESAPDWDYKFSGSMGGSKEVDDGVRIGGFASFFYERESSFFDDGVNDRLWVFNPGGPLVPQTTQGSPTPPGQPQTGDFKTSLFDVTQGTEQRQWGGLGTFGVETENHFVGLTYLYTRTTEDTATLAEDTRGKEFFFEDYDPDDPTDPGNSPDSLQAAPYLRTETLEYTERTAETIQLGGRHTLQADWGPFRKPEIDWTLSKSEANLDQPDKRQFGSLWRPESFNPGAPPFQPPFTSPAEHFPFKPAANFNLGNVQRIWKEITEDSDQYSVNLKLPFENWTDREGYLKFGVFDDTVDREFNQDTYSNFGDAGASFQGDWDQFWSEQFPLENHALIAAETDVDYDGTQDIEAWYYMMDVPLSEKWTLIGGARFESTDITIQNDPESEAFWFPPGATAPVALDPPDSADVDFDQDDILPSIGLVYTPTEEVTIRGSYSETVARQTFKELTPVIQQEFLGGPIFIGNPELEMSALKNYDLRVDYQPYEGALLSASWFKKDIDDPIENVQRFVGFDFTTPVNYPEGTLDGYEIEARQHLGVFWEALEGLSVGANATFIDSEVKLSQEDIDIFADPSINVPITERDATNAPEHLYNLYVTYDFNEGRSQVALFYTVRGDTLVAGATGVNGTFVPDVYAKEFETLNFTASHRLGERTTLKFQAKNLTNPDIEEVYRSPVTVGDVTRSSFTRGREYSLSVAVRF